MKRTGETVKLIKGQEDKGHALFREEAVSPVRFDIRKMQNIIENAKLQIKIDNRKGYREELLKAGRIESIS